MNDALIVRKNKGAGQKTTLEIPNGISSEVLRKMLDDYESQIKQAKYDILIKRITYEVVIPINSKKYGQNTI